MSRIVESLYSISNISLNEGLIPDDFNSVRAMGNYVANKLVSDRHDVKGYASGEIDVLFEINGKKGKIVLDLNSDDSVYINIYYDTDNKDVFRMVFYDRFYEMQRTSTLYSSAPTYANITTKSELDNIINYLNHFIRSKAKKISNSSLAAQFGMTDKYTNYYGLRGQFARYTMAIANNFKYDDVCEYDKQITSILKKVFKKAHFPAINNPDREAVVNKVWRLKANPNILLVSTTGYHFLTLEGALLADVKNIIKQFKEKEQ